MHNNKGEIMTYKILVYFSIIVIGYVTKKSNFLNENAGAILTKIIIYITLPVIIIEAVTSIRIRPDLFSLTIFGMISAFVILAVGWIIFTKSKLSDATKGSLILTLCGLNLAIFAYPFAQLIWGSTGLTYMAMFDIGNALIIYTLGYSLALRYSSDDFSVKVVLKKLITFPPLLAFLTALILNFSEAKMPYIISQLFETVGGANTFLSLITIGIYLNFKHVLREIRYITFGIGAKYLTGLAVGASLYLVSKMIAPNDPIMANIAFLSAVMPTPLLSLIYSVEKDLDPEIAGGMITITVILSSLMLFFVSAQ